MRDSGALTHFIKKQIRHYKIEDRAGLRKVEEDAWHQAFERYLVDLECPYPHTEANGPKVLEWLLSHAIGLEFSDRGEQSRRSRPADTASAASESVSFPAHTLQHQSSMRQGQGLPPCPRATRESPLNKARLGTGALASQ